MGGQSHDAEGLEVLCSKLEKPVLQEALPTERFLAAIEVSLAD